MELADTVNGMLSDDYKDRFKAEYDQLEIRRGKLEDLLKKDRENSLDFELSCPRRILEEQHSLMTKLGYVLMERAKCEGIEL